jgi:hypothetical protein
MRNPLRKAGYWFVLGLVGVIGVLLATYQYERLGAVAGTIVGIVGVTLLPFSVVFLPMSLLAAIGYARLRAGIGVIARWHLSAAEWDRFRAFNTVRATQGEWLVNDLRIRQQTPTQGVDVIVGRKQLIADGSYHVLRPYGLPELRAVNWLNAPADPECLEFTLAYPRGRFGGVRYLTLRVPVAPAEREAGVRVYHHFHALIPQRKPGLAFRRPRLVVGCGLAVALAAALAGGGGWLLHGGGNRSDTAVIVAIVGTIVAIGALFFTAIIVLVTWPWKRT